MSVVFFTICCLVVGGDVEGVKLLCVTLFSCYPVDSGHQHVCVLTAYLTECQE